MSDGNGDGNGNTKKIKRLCCFDVLSWVLLSAHIEVDWFPVCCIYLNKHLDQYVFCCEL